MRPKRKLTYSISAKNMMWCFDKKRWVSVYDLTGHPKGASSHKYFHTANKAWRHAADLQKKGIELQLGRYKLIRHKECGGKRRRQSTYWTSKGYYT